MAKKYFFSVGPSKLYPTVERHINIALKNDILSISHRSIVFREILKNTVSNLRQLMGIPFDYELFFVSSATEVWERLIQNCVKENSYHLITGMLSKNFMNVSKSLCKNTYFQEYGLNCDYESIKTCKIPSKCEAICIVHTESSIGMEIPMDYIYILRNRFPDKLILVDFTSSFPCIKVDFDKIDSFFFSVQKGFGLPSGLGVWGVNERCLIKANNLVKTNSIGSYHSILSLSAFAKKNETPETPNILGIYLLGKVCEDMIKSEIDLINKSSVNSNKVYSFFEKQSFFKPLIREPNFRAKTINCIESTNIKNNVINYLEKENIVISKGLPHYDCEYFRIGNFPSHSNQEINYLLKIVSGFINK
jgi:phosphoserine aminotransferase